MRSSLLIALFAGVVFTSCHESWGEKTSREAEEYTQTKCPRRMDAFTVLDSMTYTPEDSTMNYYYCVNGKLDVDSIYTPDIIGSFKKDLLNNVRGNVEIRQLKDHRVTFHYIYRSVENGKIYMDISFTPNDYN